MGIVAFRIVAFSMSIFEVLIFQDCNCQAFWLYGFSCFKTSTFGIMASGTVSFWIIIHIIVSNSWAKGTGNETSWDKEQRSRTTGQSPCSSQNSVSCSVWVQGSMPLSGIKPEWSASLSCDVCVWHGQMWPHPPWAAFHLGVQPILNPQPAYPQCLSVINLLWLMCVSVLSLV